MTVIEVLEGTPGSWRVSSSEYSEASTHPSKTAAVRHAQSITKKGTSIRIVVHNEDGSIDKLEHGFGNPDTTPPQFLASSSGSNYPVVEESIGNILSRGAHAVIKKEAQSGSTTIFNGIRQK